MSRLAFALACLAGGLALAQPNTYFVPIAQRTVTPVVGANAMGTSIWLPDQSVDPNQTLLFGVGSGSLEVFPVAAQGSGSITNVPTQADAIATAPGVLVQGVSKTLIAVLGNGAISLYTIDDTGSGIQAFVPRNPASGPIDAGTQIALSAVAGGRAALLVADGFRITRFEIDMTGSQTVVTPGSSMSASPPGTTDQSNALVFDGINNIGFVGGRVLGDIYQFDPRLDAGPPSAFDIALVSQGRLAAPVTGFALYSVTTATYLLAANNQGVTLYDLRSGTPVLGGIRIIPFDAVGPITGPAGVAVTNLPVGTGFPKGFFAVGDRTQTDLAELRWDVLAGQVDGGLTIDTLFDPRVVFLPDSGLPDAGVDGGVSDGGSGGTPGGGGGGPVGPGIPVEHDSSCATAAGTPVLLLLLGALGLLPRRRQRR
ncbi:MAG TPA: hypothetical protein VFN91_03440 [Myxococcaceae bacterium]|nr:hypothetical protein [Myxococcaceae bacterium]